MGVAKQLYQLQELDQEIEADEQALSQKASLLGQNQAILQLQAKLAEEQKRLEELKHQQHSAEWEIDDIESKIKAAEEQLYSGRITNPKELASLHHEVDLLKKQRDQLETDALEIIERVEQAEASLATTSNELKQLENEWHSQQQQLSAEIADLQGRLADLKQQRQRLSGTIDPQALECYERIRKQKRQPVARVEQGICRGCRISLPFSELQRARSGHLVQCSSCGRILFLP